MMNMKNLVIKQAFVILLSILLLFVCNLRPQSAYANRQELFPTQKKSLQEEAAVIEKDFGVKVLQDEGGLYCEIKSGEYLNDQYGFRVVVPDGLRGLTNVPPHPHHGFFIRLAQTTVARIWINAAYNAVVFETLTELVDAEIKSCEFAFPNFELRKRTANRLHNIPGVRLLAQYSDKVSGQLMISEQLIALKKDGEDDLGIIYQLSLETPNASYETDRKIFQQIINSWRMVSETVEIEKEREK